MPAHAVMIGDVDALVEFYDVGVWPSGLARWLVDFVLAVVGSNPSHG